jgi:transcriptional regulator GlxA family with amidase domain
MALGAAAAAWRTRAQTGQPGQKALPLKPPASDPVKVAVIISKDATLIDFAGPWEVFQDVDGQGFQLYTVSETTEPLRASAGLQLVPDYTFETAPAPNLVVMGAQRGHGPKVIDWIQKTHPKADLTMSVCTGAFLLAKTGLLKGLEATTHHDFFDSFEKQFPDVKLRRGLRFVEGAPKIATAGGLTSGVDMALRVVERYYGRPVAEKTAEYMEYQSASWKVG